ncbi:MAG: FxsA family protein [Burkholderiales bacterium]|nr:FxsA family protein [Burkholderiales bacterium]
MKILLLILLGFSVLEIYFLVKLADHIGGLAVIALLIASAYAGWQLLKSEFRSLLNRIFTPASFDGFPARKMIAGILLILPGIISDIAAILLLLWPRHSHEPDNGIIEGKFHRMD